MYHFVELLQSASRISHSILIFSFVGELLFIDDTRPNPAFHRVHCMPRFSATSPAVGQKLQSCSMPELQHTTTTAATIENGAEILEQHMLTTAAAAPEESQILERKHMKTMTAATKDEEEILEQHTMKTFAATNDESEILEQQQATRAEACGDDGSSHKGRD